MRISTGHEGNPPPPLRARPAYQLRLIAAAIAILAAGTFGAHAGHAGADKGRRPISARVEITRELPASTLEVGNVIVKYADGTEEKWTKEGNCFDPKVSPAGVVAWVVCTLQKDGKSLVMDPDLPLNGKLRICKNGAVLATVSAACPYIEDWGFTKDGRHVVIKSREAHGMAEIQLFALKNGPAGETWRAYRIPDEDAPLPKWALPYKDD